MYLPKPGADFQLVPAGTHKAVCYRVIHLGTQEWSFQGKPKKGQQVQIYWELPEEKMEDDRPLIISKRYNISSHPQANLIIDLESWRGMPFKPNEFGEGSDFDFSKLLKVGCIITVVHATSNDRTYANITSIGKLMKGMSAPELINQPQFLWIDPNHPEWWNQIVFNSLSDKLKETIEKSPEFQKLLKSNGNGTAKVDADMDDDIPF